MNVEMAKQLLEDAFKQYYKKLMTDKKYDCKCRWTNRVEGYAAMDGWVALASNIQDRLTVAIFHQLSPDKVTRMVQLEQYKQLESRYNIKLILCITDDRYESQVLELGQYWNAL